MASINVYANLVSDIWICSVLQKKCDKSGEATSTSLNQGSTVSLKNDGSLRLELWQILAYIRITVWSSSIHEKKLC